MRSHIAPPRPVSDDPDSDTENMFHEHCRPSKEPKTTTHRHLRAAEALLKHRARTDRHCIPALERLSQLQNPQNTAAESDAHYNSVVTAVERVFNREDDPMQLLLRGRVMVGLEKYSEEKVERLEDWDLLEGELKELNDELTEDWEMIDGEEVEKMMEEAERGVDFWVDYEVFEDAAERFEEAANSGENAQRPGDDVVQKGKPEGSTEDSDDSDDEVIWDMERSQIIVHVNEKIDRITEDKEMSEDWVGHSQEESAAGRGKKGLVVVGSVLDWAVTIGSLI